MILDNRDIHRKWTELGKAPSTNRTPPGNTYNKFQNRVLVHPSLTLFWLRTPPKRLIAEGVGQTRANGSSKNDTRRGVAKRTWDVVERTSQPAELELAVQGRRQKIRVGISPTIPPRCTHRDRLRWLPADGGGGLQAAAGIQCGHESQIEGTEGFEGITTEVPKESNEHLGVQRTRFTNQEMGGAPTRIFSRKYPLPRGVRSSSRYKVTLLLICVQGRGIPLSNQRLHGENPAHAYASDRNSLSGSVNWHGRPHAERKSVWLIPRGNSTTSRCFINGISFPIRDPQQVTRRISPVNWWQR